jgi:hypothetical protein
MFTIQQITVVSPISAPAQHGTEAYYYDHAQAQSEKYFLHVVALSRHTMTLPFWGKGSLFIIAQNTLKFNENLPPVLSFTCLHLPPWLVCDYLKPPLRTSSRLKPT